MNIWEFFAIFIPVYFANAAPVFLGGELPIDKIIGRKVFGKNKTVLGLISAFSVGTIVAYILYLFFPEKEFFVLALWAIAGAIFGDLFGSFLKRRMELKEGAPHTMDQFFFIIFALVFVAFVDWRAFLFSSMPLAVLVLLIVSPLLHKASNVVAYMFKLKKVPW